MIETAFVQPLRAHVTMASGDPSNSPVVDGILEDPRSPARPEAPREEIETREPDALDKALFAFQLVTLGLVTYHGYRRNNGSLGWAFAWAAVSTLSPIITLAVAFAQGFGEPLPKKKK